MQRWNDKIHPVKLRELDKQSHKMIIAYLIGKFEEESNSEDFSWTRIIEGGIFEFLQRLVVTDLKPQLFHRIKEDPGKYIDLNKWVYKEIQPIIAPLGDSFCTRFQNYLSEPGEDLNRRILGAAHFYATKWEFDIIERANPEGYEIAEIKSNVQSNQERYYDLKGLQQLVLYSNPKNFVDLCGELRFQVRWSHLHRIHETSVLGHMLIVATLSYLFSLEIGACEKRCINNYFTGLFHDLPEVLTRDVANPVKNSIQELSGLIKEYEKEEMEKKVYRLIPKKWHSEIRMFTENEFESVVTIDDKIEKKTSDEISRNFNENHYNPKDGEIVKAADHLAAFVEAYLELKSDTHNPAFDNAKRSLKNRYGGKSISGINLGDIYADFD